MHQALPQAALDAEWFWSAFDAGALDACLLYLRGETQSEAPDATANCRLAEALLHRGRGEQALECCRRGFSSAADDAAMLHICAWVFSNTGCDAEAADAYRRLLALRPEWIDGHRHLSGSLAAVGRVDDAIEHATAACDLAPDNVEYALHASTLLLAAGRHDEAAAYAEYAAALAGGDPRLVTDAAEALMQCDRIDDAAALLAEIADSTGDARSLRVLSAAEMLRGRPESALAAIDLALTAARGNTEYYLHRGHLLWQLGDLDGAAASFETAAAIDPAGRDVKRAQMSLYAASGLLHQATAAAGELLHRFPDDNGSAEAVLHLLNHRLDTIDGDYVVLPGDARRERQSHPWPGPLDRLRNQWRVIRALIIRETRTRFAEFRLGYAWALIEPILHIALLSVMFAVLMHGRPPIGEHFFQFYYTGLIPYLIFAHASSGMSHAVTGNAPLLQLPPVTTFDVVAARGILEIVTDIVVAIVLLGAFSALGVATTPHDLWDPSIALLVTAAFGFGIGFVNAVLTALWRSWEKIYNQLTRILYFVSGIFYVPGMMPDGLRNALTWNPLLHAIDWFRAGFFTSYQPHWLDRPYLVVTAMLSLLAGLTLQRGFRRRLSAPL